MVIERSRNDQDGLNSYLIELIRQTAYFKLRPYLVFTLFLSSLCMKALTFQGKQQIVYTNSPDPVLVSADDVIVRILVTAVCGSDLHVYHGRETGLDCGTIMGHELVGEVVEKGKNVRNFRIGDRVVSPFSTNCGVCYYCQIGLTCRCSQSQLYGWVAYGKGLHGVQAEYARVPNADATLLRFDASLSPETALLIADVRSTGYHCAVQAGIGQLGYPAANSVVVLGCGAVGLMALVAALELGAERVYALDILPERLSLAEVYGGIGLVGSPPEEAIAQIMEATDGRGADVVLEAIGGFDALSLSYRLVRPGGIISSVGVHTNEQFPFSPIAAYDKNLTFKAGRAPVRRYMPHLLAQAHDCRFDIGKIITHRFGLSDGAEAYRVFAERRNNCIKALLLP